MRGSSPCHGPEVERYGGNTSCVHVAVPGHEPILFDLGSGARGFGHAWAGAFEGTCLLSHLHLDHVLGLPFFPPILRAGGRLDVVVPHQEDGRRVREVVDTILCPPLFPVGLDVFPGDVAFRECGEEDFAIGDVRVLSRFVPHIGPTLGFRLEWNGASVAYVSDHQQPGIDDFAITDGVRELCDGVDLLIHDGQFTPSEFARKPTWGHCTAEFACWVARECGASTLALYHHDPTHDDDQLDAMVDALRARCGDTEVFAARERSTIRLAG